MSEEINVEAVKKNTCLTLSELQALNGTVDPEIYQATTPEHRQLVKELGLILEASNQVGIELEKEAWNAFTAKDSGKVRKARPVSLHGFQTIFSDSEADFDFHWDGPVVSQFAALCKSASQQGIDLAEEMLKLHAPAQPEPVVEVTEATVAV